MASMTSPTTRAGSSVGFRRHRRASRSKRSGDGGTRWDGTAFPMRNGCSSPPMPGFERLPVNSGSWSWPHWRRDRAGHHRLPLPARHLQLEQDRAPHVQLHLDELARAPARVLSNDHRADRSHHNRKGLDDPCRAGRNSYEKGIKVFQRRTRRASHSFVTSSTATGTTPLPLAQPCNQTIGEPDSLARFSPTH